MNALLKAQGVVRKGAETQGAEGARRTAKPRKRTARKTPATPRSVDTK